MTDYAKHSDVEWLIVEWLIDLRTYPGMPTREHQQALTAAIELMRAAMPKPCKGCGRTESCYWMWDAQRKCCPDCSCTDPRDDIAAARAEGYAQGHHDGGCAQAMFQTRLEEARNAKELAAAKAESERLRQTGHQRASESANTAHELSAKLENLRAAAERMIDSSPSSDGYAALIAAIEASR